MDNEIALKTLIANVCCVNDIPNCNECPLYEKNDNGELYCKGFYEEDLLKAVSVVKLDKLKYVQMWNKLKEHLIKQLQFISDDMRNQTLEEILDKMHDFEYEYIK